MSTQGFVVWLTGLSGAGKTTIATSLAERLQLQRQAVELLDGDSLRQTLCKDLGFSREDRAKNIERVGFVAGLLSKHGVGVIAAFISPYKRERELVRAQSTNFIEVFVNAPLTVCEVRDPKGLYKKARAGKIERFTGISDPYEEPFQPELEVRTDKGSVEACTDQIEQYLHEQSLVKAVENPHRERKW